MGVDLSVKFVFYLIKGFLFGRPPKKIIGQMSYLGHRISGFFFDWDGGCWFLTVRNCETQPSYALELFHRNKKKDGE